MANCRLRISWDGPGQPVVVNIWDSAGNKTNISPHFVSSGGVTKRINASSGLVTTEMHLKKEDDGMSANLEFVPLNRVIVFGISESVYNQMKQFCIKKSEPTLTEVSDEPFSSSKERP